MTRSTEIIFVSTFAALRITEDDILSIEIRYDNRSPVDADKNNTDTRVNRSHSPSLISHMGIRTRVNSHIIERRRYRCWSESFKMTPKRYLTCCCCNPYLGYDIDLIFYDNIKNTLKGTSSVSNSFNKI